MGLFDKFMNKSVDEVFGDVKDVASDTDSPVSDATSDKPAISNQAATRQPPSSGRTTDTLTTSLCPSTPNPT